MRNWLDSFLRSFSFRVGILIFLTLYASFLSVRLLVYRESVITANQDIRLIIDAHAEEIDEGMKKYGIPYVRKLVDAILDDTREKHLYLLVSNKGKTTGNLTNWPPGDVVGTHWKEITLPRLEEAPLHLLVKSVAYTPHMFLLVGYDLARLDNMRDKLYDDLLKNAAICLVLSLVVSVIIMWLLGNRLRRINKACEEVMTGQLAYRIVDHGANDQCESLGRNFNRMLDWITMLLETVKDTTNSLAHDLRTPLSRHRLKLNALLQDPTTPPALQERLQDAINDVDTLTTMFESILNIAKAEGRSEVVFTSFDIVDLLRDMLELYDVVIEDYGLKLEHNLPSTPFMMRGDCQLIAQAVSNVLDNAVKYTPEGGSISVSLQKKSGNMVLEVSDSGPGIPEEFRDRVTERFFRLDKARNQPGSGLGLSLVHAVVRLHHGEMQMEDNAPGLRVVITLPYQPSSERLL